VDIACACSLWVRFTRFGYGWRTRPETVDFGVFAIGSQSGINGVYGEYAAFGRDGTSSPFSSGT
jgi:hypothetical protein